MFEIKIDKNGEYLFHLKARNGQVILSNYHRTTTKAACENRIESIRRNSQDDSKYLRMKAKNGFLYFQLKAENGRILGSSEMYLSKAAMENGIASVKKNAPDAELKIEL